MKKRNEKIVIAPADPDFKRDVTNIIKNLKSKLKDEKPFEQHIYSVLMKTS